MNQNFLWECCIYPLILRLPMLEKQYTITNRQGLHARPAAMFVKISNRFKCEVWVTKEGEQVNGNSIMGLMILAAEEGAKIDISTDGEDEKDAMDSLGALIESGFTKEA